MDTKTITYDMMNWEQFNESIKLPIKVGDKVMMGRFKNKEDITFFDPNEVPDLYEAFYKDTARFEELYVK